MRHILAIFLFLTLIFHVTASGPSLQLENGKKSRDYIRESQTLKSAANDIIPKFPLPQNLEPINYNIQIMPILDNFPEIGEQFTAPGTVKILLNCVGRTNVITLHSFLLEINNASVVVIDKESGDPVPIMGQNSEEEKHFYHIHVQELEAGKQYEVSIGYIAPVSTDRANGLYLASYVDPPTGQLRYVAATQLEPARARQVFPSFDEPRWKPTFDVTIGRRINYTSLCNSPQIGQREHDTYPDWIWDEYNTTVPMPTYLFSMAVSDYTFEIADTSLYRLPVRTYAAKHLIDSGVADYSVDASARIMKFFEEHYDVQYPMHKVDNIVVPGKGGAMENYGLITYGDFLLYNVDETTEAERQRLVSVVSHELAHQWFGNLVTCISWSHIYLNEGFATYVSFVGLEPFYNEYFPRKYILNDAVQNAFLLDAGPLSHPIVVEDVYTIPDINSHFSSLQYDKGGSLIRMMEGFLSENTLNMALRKYLKRKVNGVAEQDDLFQDLTDQAHLDGTLASSLTVKHIMDTWTLQKGFPLVRVSYWDVNKVLLSQERFVNRNSQWSNRAEDDLWEIPISVTTQVDPDFQNYTPAVWMEKNVVAKIFTHDTSKWIMINLDGMSFYRVLYEGRLTDLIMEQLKTDYSVISPLSRSQLVDDYLNLAWQGYVSIETALSVTEYMAKESDFTVWNAFFTTFRSAFLLLSASDASAVTNAYLTPRLDAALQSIGLEQSPADKGALVLLRAQLLDWACSMGHAGCINYAQSLLTNWEQNPGRSPFPLDLQPVLYCSAIANGGVTTFNFFVDKYKTEQSNVHKSRIMSALACVTEASLVDELLGLSLNETSGFTKPDSAALLHRFATNSEARAKLFTLLKERIAEIISFYGSATPIGSAITILSSYYSTSVQLNEVQAFITENAEELKDVQSTLTTALEKIAGNIAWQSNFYGRIKTWFETHP